MGGRQSLISFTIEESSDTCLEIDKDQRVRDEVITDRLYHLLDGASVEALRCMTRGQRDQVIRQLKAIEGARIRQIAALTGLGKTVVERA